MADIRGLQYESDTIKYTNKFHQKNYHDLFEIWVTFHLHPPSLQHTGNIHSLDNSKQIACLVKRNSSQVTDYRNSPGWDNWLTSEASSTKRALMSARQYSLYLQHKFWQVITSAGYVKLASGWSHVQYFVWINSPGGVDWLTSGWSRETYSLVPDSTRMARESVPYPGPQTVKMNNIQEHVYRIWYNRHRCNSCMSEGSLCWLFHFCFQNLYYKTSNLLWTQSIAGSWQFLLRYMVPGL